ncbi:uncharacterized protein PFL1_05389 [Pseudozyma flocculosa PF-1]|uniref:Protein farnesyltransferase subunit beta n=2 Tax=Pseudozyma flocculosa TaxID=84751 RepID=A0A5C3FCD8_9BASI|nr:uncharacterized protein PFL1_05389 [Pseudozyma flocculosa PF-1]EPQ27107.1 hypothetical protein PFL1_05389 [Pseudozyma flocculosa PF-1]SPO41325.1 related to RAM1 - protein farnesyltransferase, beta subunit [Pseudozyma flocculosa]
MPATTYPTWPTPTDNIYSTTTDDQLETENDIHDLFAKHRHPSLNHRHPSSSSPSSTQGRLPNPWHQDPPSATNTSQNNPQDGTPTPHDAPAPIPPLNRQAHLNFLIKQIDPLPASFVGFDTNRAWLLYWILHSYDLLSATLDASGRARAIATLVSFQNTLTGGFGGGPDQIPHLMSTFAAVLALATIGGPGPCPDADDVRKGKSIEIGKGGWDAIDRQKMYRWMLSLKQPDGSFLVHENGEVDVRASYCVVTVSTLLGICTPQLVRGLGDFIASCQTYEGGLAAGSQPQYAYHAAATSTAATGQIPYLPDPHAYRPQLGEAHGGYAYCALATHLALSRLPYCGDGPILPSPSPSPSPALAPSATTTKTTKTSSAGDLDVPRLVRWATSLQGVPIEGGGFRGRTNKLVDGCYGWFCGGGLFTVLSPVVEEYERRTKSAGVAHHGRDGDETPTMRWLDNGIDSLPTLPPPAAAKTKTTQGEVRSDSEDSWTTDESIPHGAAAAAAASASAAAAATGLGSEGEGEVDRDPEVLYDRVALQEYILIAAQAPKGGLRDKPGKRPDAYHTNYNLSGLSLAQHRLKPSEATRSSLLSLWKDGGMGKEEERGWRKEVYLSALSWTLDPRDSVIVAGSDGERENNTLQPTHPLFSITFPKAKAFMDWSYAQMVTR